MSKPTPVTFEQQLALARALPEIAAMIDAEIKKATGQRIAFSLYTWGGNRAQYISNAPREDTKRAMQECLDRWEQRDDPLPTSFA